MGIHMSSAIRRVRRSLHGALAALMLTFAFLAASDVDAVVARASVSGSKAKSVARVTHRRKARSRRCTASRSRRSRRCVVRRSRPAKKQRAKKPPAKKPKPAPAPVGVPPLADARPFAKTSFWNAPLAGDAPLDPGSAGYVSELVRQVRDYGPWMNTVYYSTPVYTVPSTQPAVKVTADWPSSLDPDLRSAWEQVPIPPDAQAAYGADRHMVVWQPSSDTMWEFWGMVKSSDGWHAPYGGRMRNLSSNQGYFADRPTWGATATGIPMLGGLVTMAELRAGRIDHALALAIPDARARWFSWPAVRTDGNTSREDAIPEGARFRLDPHLDIASLALPRFTRMLAEAAQRYGIVLRDRAGAVVFYGEDPTPLGADNNPYRGPDGFFEGKMPSELLARFPWSSLQVLRTDMRSS
jgi:hypothetical protein